MSWEQDGKRIDISSGSSVHSYYLSPRGGGGFWRGSHGSLRMDQSSPTKYEEGLWEIYAN